MVRLSLRCIERNVMCKLLVNGFACDCICLLCHRRGRSVSRHGCLGFLGANSTVHKPFSRSIATAMLPLPERVPVSRVHAL
jgi:hypothetical protein